LAANSLVELVRLRKENRQGEAFYSKPSERMGSLRPSMLRFQMSPALRLRHPVLSCYLTTGEASYRLAHGYGYSARSRAAC